jgi:glycosyltransferase involved in cell wall biosynthesis
VTFGVGWVVLREGAQARWGGERRRQHLFDGLVARTGARVIDGMWPNAVRRGARPGGRLALLRRLLPLRPRLCSVELLRPPSLAVARELTIPAAVAIYDDPVAHAEALGIPLPPERAEELRARRQENLDTFHWQVVPTASFGALAGLDPDRIIVAGNGTDTTEIRVEPWPDQPAVSMISGAAPGRGIELLIEATGLCREALPELRLLLWLVATGEASERYLGELRAAQAARPWVEFATAEPGELSAALGRASVLCVPHPPGAYWDVALPVKVLDSMAAGRPLLVTPRTETVAIVEGHGSGIVATDTAEGLADGMRRLLTDEALSRRLGAAGRRAAEGTYDWRVMGVRLASELLRREG